MDNHTPGNCFHCGADDGLHQSETMKCPRFGVEAHFGKTQEWDEKTFVNADYQRLCDAAPFLLEACKILVENAPKLWGDDTEQWPKLMDKIEQAITKAEGKS